MEMIIDFLVYMCILATLFAPCLLCCWFFEETPSGRYLWDRVLVPFLIKHDILPDDYWDRH